MTGKKPSFPRKSIWRTARRVSQILFFLLAVALAVGISRYRTGMPWNALIGFDPLAALSVSLAARKILPGFFWGALVILLLSAVLGRVFCGWMCPLGALLEWTSPRIPRKERPGWSYRLYLGLGLLLLILGIAATGHLWAVVVDPITVATRSVITLLHPAIGLGLQSFGDLLYRAPFLRELVTRLDAFWREMGLLPMGPLRAYRYVLAFLLFLGGIVALNRIAPRFWCRAVCPLGSMLSLVGRFSPLTVAVDEEACTRCGLCADVCAILPEDAERVGEYAECWRCGDCIAVCPVNAVSYRWKLPPSLQPATFDPSRRSLLGGLLGAAGALALLRAEALGKLYSPHVIRPPGARIRVSPQGLDESEFLSRCVRCGLCWKVCPTNALHPAGIEAGPESFLTPVLVPRLGYCDYSCAACGEICPTGAIERLTLEEKRRRVIGVAYIDEKRCIPYSRYRPCTVCEEMCPVPEKAITLIEREITTPMGEKVTLLFPKVLHDACIGCGICENKCPVPDEAAIRVYAPFAL